MTEPVKRYVTTCDCMSESFWGDYVRHADYERIEQECKDARYQADLFKRAAEVFREDKEAALRQVEGLKDTLAGAKMWMEDVTKVVLYPLATEGEGRFALEAEGLGSCTPGIFKSIDAALSDKACRHPPRTSHFGTWCELCEKNLY